MPDFNWSIVENAGDWTAAGFSGRHPEWAAGNDIWRAWFEQGRWREAGEERNALVELRNDLATVTPSLRCPRVFVSHRQTDGAEALRIAWLANQQTFEFWLDILDPQLQGTTAQVPPVIVASIIEMALLNCSHVIAVLSPYTRGTLWVPYEYGRVKERRTRSRLAAVWVHPAIAAADVPAYTVLGVTTLVERDINTWFQTELRDWCRTRGVSCTGNPWTAGATVPLP